MKNTLSKLVMSSLLFAASVIVGIGLISSRAASTEANVNSGIQPASESAISTSPAPLSPNQDRVEVELLTISATGFEPSEITRPAGRFVLGVNNRVASQELSLQLVHESGRSMERKRMSEKKTWRKMVELPPGQYLLLAVGHPDWICRITILPR